ncbi:MAG: hypothetical protein AB7V27_18340, partial [Candidatus Binatia bacterium]
DLARSDASSSAAKLKSVAMIAIDFTEVIGPGSDDDGDRDLRAGEGAIVRHLGFVIASLAQVARALQIGAKDPGAKCSGSKQRCHGVPRRRDAEHFAADAALLQKLRR